MGSSRLQNRLRGWLPKEPTLSTHQTPVTTKNSPIVRWTARVLVMGCTVSGVLLIAGDLVGLTKGIGAYLWPATVLGTVWASVAVTPFLVKRKEEKQRRDRA